MEQNLQTVENPPPDFVPTRVRLSREITFKARHSHRGMMFEPSHPHDFSVRLFFEGVLNEEGFLVDFRAVKRLAHRLVVRELDGSDLDTKFAYATSENLAAWIWERLAPFFPLHSVEIREKQHSSAVYYGPGETPCA